MLLMYISVVPLVVLASSDHRPDVCQHFQSFLRQGVPEKPLRQALLFFDKHYNRFSRHDLLSIADYSVPSTKPRFFIVDLEKGTVQTEKVSHGSGYQAGRKHGDQDHDGMLDKCHVRGNRSNMTRPGFFKTGELYRSRKHTKMRRVNGRRVRQWPFLDGADRYNGLRLDGLTPGVNGHARSRGVVMHGAWYNDVQAIMGRSYGCPAFTSKRAPEVLNRIKDGTLFYAVHAAVRRRSSARRCAGRRLGSDVPTPGPFDG